MNTPNLGYAVVVSRDENTWNVLPLDDKALESLAHADRLTRQTRSQGATFSLLNVDDEFFIILRPAPTGTHYFLSDATAALDYPIAAEVLASLHIDIPDMDEEEFEETLPWAEGDFAILADLGLSEDILTVIVDDYELFADEQIERIAQQLNFATELTEVIDNC